MVLLSCSPVWGQNGTQSELPANGGGDSTRVDSGEVGGQLLDSEKADSLTKAITELDSTGKAIAEPDSTSKPITELDSTGNPIAAQDSTGNPIAAQDSTGGDTTKQASTATAKVKAKLIYKFKKVQSNLNIPERLQRKIEKSFLKARDSLRVVEIGRDAEIVLASNGYLEATFKGFKTKGKTIVADFHQGAVYQLDSVVFDGLGESEVQKAGYAKLNKKHPLLDLEDIKLRMEGNLRAFQNRGYPFARFDSLQIGYLERNDTVLSQIRYQFDAGKLVLIDSVLVEGDIREKESFVKGIVGLYTGMAFDQSAIDATPRILNNSIYFKNVKPVEIKFLDEETATLKIEVEPRKSGKFDFLLGILPPRDETARIEFTALADFQLVSPLFRAGETIEFRYDKLIGSSQKLHLKYAQPYLFSSPLNIEAEFDLLKQDTTFLTRYFRLASAYAFSPQLAVRVYLKSKTSSLISTNHYDTLSPPPVLDAKDQTYGIGFAFNNLDYRFNPRKGWDIHADFGIGRKRVIDNPTLDDRIYDGLILRLPKREFEFSIDWYRSLSKRLVLRLGNRTYWLDQEQYFENDLLQIGGSRTIRGFDENQFFTNFFSQVTVESRFLLEQNSYLFVFSDYAYLENRAERNDILRPWGIGLGLTYETRAGMVSVTYAVGQVAEFPFQPSRGRIHLGLLNQF